MAQFTYVAITAEGKEVTGLIDGPTADWVSERLAGDQLLPIEIEPLVPHITWMDEIRQHLPVGVEDISLFSSQFAMMISTGLPILATLELLSENSTKLKLRHALEEAVESIRGGSSLYAGLEASGQFPEVYINMVRAGETGGNLAEVMSQLSIYLNREAELRNKVKRALAYPTFLVCLSVAVTTFLIVAIIPRFSQVLENLGVELPLPTRILLALSSFMVGYWPWLVAGIGAVAATIFLTLRVEENRRRLDWLLLQLPLAGEVIAKNSLARFTYVLGSLLAGGIPIVDALEVARVTAGNRSLSLAIGKIRRDILDGRSITEAMTLSGSMPPLVLQMAAIGESSGSLDQVLTRVAEIYDQQVDRVTQTLVNLIEPGLVVVLGVVVGFIALSLVLPMVKAVSSIGG